MDETATDDTARLLQDAANRLFAEHFTPSALTAAEQGGFARVAWDAVAAAGLPRALLSEAAGGYGIDLADAMLLLRVAGAHAVPLPLAETMLAAWLLAGAGLGVPDGPLTVATGPTLTRRGNGWHLVGEAHGVPWGRHAQAIAVLAAPYVCLVAGHAVRVTAGRNMAGEPRDRLVCDVDLSAGDVAPAASGTDAGRLHAFGAAMRTLMLGGAMTRVAEMTALYAQQRIQFGRPIGKFQAVQQSLAALAGETAAAVAAGDIAADAVADGVRVLPIACAKLRAGEAAGIVAGLAHQVHGAMGFTDEHRLHHYTKRLWAWRDEYGAEAEWSLMLGRHAASAGADRLWPAITAI